MQLAAVLRVLAKSSATCQAAENDSNNERPRSLKAMLLGQLVEAAAICLRRQSVGLP
jgi:hypothetical protein